MGNVFKYSKTFVLDFNFPFCKLIQETGSNMGACIWVVLPGPKLVAEDGLLTFIAFCGEF